MKIVRSLVVVLHITLLAACTSLRNITNTIKRNEKNAAQASAIAKALRGARSVPPRATVVFSDEPIVALTPLPIAKPINPAESLNYNITFAPVMPVDILEFGQIVTKLCGIPVRVTPDALAAAGGQAATGAVSTATYAVKQPVPPLPPLSSMPGPGRTRAPTSSGFAAGLISNLKWSGKPLEGLLDVVTAGLGLSWRKVEGVISIFYLDTRIFNFYAIPSITDVQSVVKSGTTTAAGISGGQGGASGSGESAGVSGSAGSSQTTAVSLKTSITDDLAKNVRSMLTPNVGRMAMAPSTGTLTVTDTPEVLSRIEHYLEQENRNITKQVLLNVKVLSVTLTDKDSLGIDWGLVYKALNGNFGMGFKHLFQADASAASGSVGILDTARGRAARFASSSLIIHALAQQGRVSTITSPSVTTLNLQPVPVQVARQTSYLASVQTTHTAQVGATTSLTPGTVTTGFNMNLLPYVMPNHHLLLQYSINLSALQNLRSITSGNNTIEIPEVDNRIFSQKVRLKSGETLVLSGFEQSIDTGVKTGVGHPDNILFGGGMGADSRRDVIVVLITPIVLD